MEKSLCCNGKLSVTVDDKASVHLTTVLGRTRTVTPYDYRMTDGPPASPEPPTR